MAGVGLTRSSGVLLHPTSLPGGRLGDEAYRFVDWLAEAGQSWWQVLPLGPPDEHGSPYRGRSAFAGWTGLLADPRSKASLDELEAFVARHPYWIGDWASFDVRGAVAGQVRFEREWSALRRYAAERGIRIFGDLPIYVSGSGADVAAHPELFESRVVAGAPPDPFNPTGQLWGSPVYRWATARAERWRWWIERFRRTLELFDLVRIDHFRGFVSYWAVPAGAKTAKGGRWRRGPGAEPFEVARRALGDLPLVAEDLGAITPAVVRLRERLGLPGMVVLQFGFEGGSANPHRLENHPENAVVYTGTHDNDTALGWWSSLTAAKRRATGLDPADPSWSLVERALSSRARLALLPAQDLLGLGSEARLNTPGRADGNWSWRLRRGQLTSALAARLRAATEAAGRGQHSRA
ncbi:MAG TPA: 4-alpha-glucanotransferase [Thermoleophilaceae bacterium]|nr:4-alpha-glucanotransferase [Thermoleophilaceae bacterium]